MKKMWGLRVVLSAFVLTVALAVGGGSAWALTSPETTTVGIVDYAAGNLYIQDAGGNQFFAQLSTQAGCTANNQTSDTIKTWLSLGQSALQAGKNVRIYFNVCGGLNYISTLDLDR